MCCENEAHTHATEETEVWERRTVTRKQNIRDTQEKEKNGLLCTSIKMSRSFFAKRKHKRSWLAWMLTQKLSPHLVYHTLARDICNASQTTTDDAKHTRENRTRHLGGATSRELARNTLPLLSFELAFLSITTLCWIRQTVAFVQASCVLLYRPGLRAHVLQGSPVANVNYSILRSQSLIWMLRCFLIWVHICSSVWSTVLSALAQAVPQWMDSETDLEAIWNEL